MPSLCLNARFMQRAPTGVDRVAIELTRALVDLGADIALAQPGGPNLAQDEVWPDMPALPVAAKGPMSGYGWEQGVLPMVYPRDWQLNLCNLGPVLRRRQILMIHDAQIRETPSAYSKPFRMAYRVLQPLAARRAALVLTVSDHSRRQLEHFGIVPRGKAQVLPNGADHILRPTPDGEILIRHGLRPGRYFLTIGSLAPHKNLDVLMRANTQRTSRDWPLVIAGGGNPKIFAGRGITPTDDVKVLGRITDPELRALYENAGALCFPSRTEGFGLPPVEAMTCGCPVIASTGGAIPETCGEAALFADPDAPARWAALMDHISQSDETRMGLITRGYTRARQLTWRASAQRLIGLINAQDAAAMARASDLAKNR